MMISFALAAVITIEPVIPVHSWYDRYCCQDKDCGPALSADYGDSGLMIETSPGQWLAVPKGMTLRPSVDQNWHVCIMHGTVRCVYAPAGS